MMRADVVRPGDVVDYHGELHHISRVELRDGWAWPVACDDAGWGIALGHDLVVRSGNTVAARRSVKPAP
jgi:hypothetical protein